MGTELFLCGEADPMSSFSRLRFLADEEESFAISTKVTEHKVVMRKGDGYATFGISTASDYYTSQFRYHDDGDGKHEQTRRAVGTL